MQSERWQQTTTTHHDPGRQAGTLMLHITRPARHAIDEAWRRGRVLTLELGWAGFPRAADTDVTWTDAGDSSVLARLVPVSERPGSAPVYVARGLLPLIHRGLTVRHQRLFGIWPRMAVVATLP
jgi:hypothetical protein